MKANTPEKIYVPTTGDELHYHMACPNNEFQESIEYTCTDAFIEKACEWLGEHLMTDYWSQRIASTDYFIEKFKKAMEE